MSQLTHILSLYARFISFMTHRFVAAWFMVLGTLMALMDSYVLLPGKTLDFNGKPASNLLIRLLYVFFPLFVAFFGWLLWHYRPLDRFRAWMVRHLLDDSRS